VPQRVIGQIVLLVPGGRGPVQCRHPAGLSGLQPVAEPAGEQVVVAPPAAHLIQRHKNSPARSARSSSAWLPVRPVTASHSSPDSRSSTEVSSTKSLHLGGRGRLCGSAVAGNLDSPVRGS
jgi:hypothetical protein